MSTPSSPAMRMHMILVGRLCRTRWSQSGIARRSRVPSVSGEGNHEAVLVGRSRLRSGSRWTPRPSSARASSPHGSSSTSPRSSGIATRTSQIVTSPRSRSWPACATGHSRPATEARTGTKRHARARLDEELALIGELGLAGFFLLHWEVLQLAADVAREVRGRESPRHSLPPGRGRAARSARSSAT